MEQTCILAIESSCDETAVAIVENTNQVLANVVATQIDVHKEFGGVIPEVASRIHVENISMVIAEALKKANKQVSDMDAIAVTKGPGLIGSLHVGVQAAKTLAWSFHKPLVPVHHICGHIYANALVKNLKYPMLALVVSGGHTELVYLKAEYEFEILGTTQDDAVGEAYDKVARVMGLPYPGGPQIDRLAKEGKPVYKLPHPKTAGEMDYSFSGLKSGVLQFIDRCKRKGETYVAADLAASFQETALDELLDKLKIAIDQKHPAQVVLAGGVAANSRLRERLTKLMEEAYPDIDYIIPPLSCCTDNAAMIGVAGTIAYQHGVRGDFDLTADCSMEM
ncbi:MAG: tRNA (adenosine(37)-N6)-threonylcarbamoyltransferase complex transferase subunit TsaD [Erysipelotrichaceae bacterium]|uniref:tRNA N6-adenosine threonylcarbamoyltransferase n=1 Tax=Copranaerobaculum intestinale TaxID=2692629 RepID=A0A6N8U9K2_9FIRM|nr:tRNA (adenosine(37)-N6)-threonylcarbamoyltransferase complex transferase subunit TsaD [Copranaerobaculum intestinale]MBS6372987.1 tRNA (adenosine(37)-N6)-threonylcarbamoyltransferase complex transferase subunit TsaD [Erysipelotrichaceae bacterium]MXQ73259.1 tRNA (adenosine(37)-N6)-threonylcarbamoyltransferase complex transferase subunit TsaD [Copranaerobaculum intestinale]